MKTLRYKILLRKEDDGTYTVIVPSLPGCLTFGRTVEEALAMAKEAIEGFIACMIARGEEVNQTAIGILRSPDLQFAGITHGIHTGTFTHRSESPE